MAEEILLDANHKYSLTSGKRLIGVTETLTHFGFIDATWFTKIARDVGTATHHGVHLIRSGFELDPATVDPRVGGRLLALQKFERETGWVSLNSELRLWNPLYLYGGTADDLGYFLGGSASRYRGPGLVDYKSGKISDWTAYQTGAYEECPRPPDFQDRLPSEFRGKPIRRFGVQLMPTGDYDLVPFADHNDGARFCSLVSNLWWKLNHKYKIEKGVPNV